MTGSSGMPMASANPRTSTAAPSGPPSSPYSPATPTERSGCAARSAPKSGTRPATRSAEKVLALDPDFTGLGDLAIGVVGPYAALGDGRYDGPDGAAVEVRGYALDMGIPEDPVTGSLNAVVGQWLMPDGLLPQAYVASQGTALGRAGRVHVTRDDSQTVWVGGDAVTCIEGTVLL